MLEPEPVNAETDETLITTPSPDAFSTTMRARAAAPLDPGGGPEHGPRRFGPERGPQTMDMMNGTFWLQVLQIIWINILLSGDNAVVIALACRGLPPQQQKWGVALGAGAAVVLRIVFTIFIAYLLMFFFAISHTTLQVF